MLANSMCNNLPKTNVCSNSLLQQKSSNWYSSVADCLNSHGLPETSKRSNFAIMVVYKSLCPVDKLSDIGPN